MQGVLPQLEVEDQIVMHKDPACARRHFEELVATNPDLRIGLQRIGNDRLDALSRAVKRHYVPLAPDFVVEVKSPSDSEREQRAKCRQWLANGTELAWLINGDKQTVWEYYGDTEERYQKPESLKGRGPVEGFVLDLVPIWRGV